MNSNTPSSAHRPHAQPAPPHNASQGGDDAVRAKVEVIQVEVFGEGPQLAQAEMRGRGFGVLVEERRGFGGDDEDGGVGVGWLAWWDCLVEVLDHLGPGHPH